MAPKTAATKAKAKAPSKAAVKSATKRAAAKAASKAAPKAATVKLEPESPSRPAAPQEMVLVSDTVDKKDISNFLGQMKRATSDDAQALYQHYQSLGKFDPEKQTILSKWKQDKSCKWYTSYSETFQKSTTSKKKSAVGWSTRPGKVKKNMF